MKPILLIPTLICMLQLKALAAYEEYFNFLSGSGIEVNKTLDVKDGKFKTPLWSSIEKNISATDLVILEIDDNATTPLPGVPFTCKVDLQIVAFKSESDSVTYLKSLALTFDPGLNKKYKTKAAFKFINAYRIKITIKSISYKENNFPQAIKPFFKLTGDIQVSRIYKFDGNFVINPNHVDTSKGYVQIGWPAQTGAEEYDLEWSFLDDSSKIAMSDLPIAFSDLFRENATRVTTGALNYRFRRMVCNGYIFYRVRGVHYDKNHRRQNGKWSGSLLVGVIASFQDKLHTSGISNAINWQYNVGFAEGGKKSESLNYLDGTLRNRELLSYNNSNRQIIVGERFYDHIGRPAVYALPVPLANDSIMLLHYPFNKAGGQAYNYNNWETGNCSAFPLAMDSTMAASFYYSSNNPDTLDFQKYLPKAQGFPFVVSEFTSDQTNRIRRQSSAGKYHQLGLHSTQYFYGKPEQRDLDRLFGSEAGLSAHYFKNMVVDPNGQVSVDYIDAHGRTIATALAAVPPPNLTMLPNNAGSTTEVYNLLDNNQPFSYGKANTRKMLNTNPSDFKFSYTALPATLEIQCGEEQLCYDGYYDLNITITDDCLNSTLPGSVPFIVTDNNYGNTLIFDTLCDNAVQSFTESFTLPKLPPGGYTISKTLTVNEAAVQFYTQHYLRNNLCLVDSDVFIQQAIAAIDFSGCNINCEECKNAIGTKETFVANYLDLLAITDSVINAEDSVTAENAYNAALEGCDEACNGHGRCDALYGVMLNDVTPGNQWAQYYIDGTGTYHAKDQLSSLFYYMNLAYFDENGNPDSVYYDGQMRPPNTVPLKYFVLNFKPIWANALVIWHPEYCYYKFCIDNALSNAYDDEMMRITSFSQAEAEGFINPAPGYNYIHPGISASSNKDPFFEQGGWGDFSSFPDSIIEHLKHFTDVGTTTSHKMSAWAFSMATVNCADNNVNFLAADTSYASGCSGDKDAAWNLFKGIYQSLKFKYLDIVREAFISTDTAAVSPLQCHSNLCMTFNYNPSFLGSNYDWIDDNYCNAQNDPYNVIGYVPRVTHFESALPFTSLTEPNTVNLYVQEALDAQVDSNCEASCKAQADYWMQQLTGCEMSAADSIAVREGLIEVCLAGCDITHPTGASTTPDGMVTSPNGYDSFAGVLQKVLNVSPYDTSACSASMISLPAPYNMPLQKVNYSLYTKNQCVCDKFTALLDSFELYGVYVNFSAFLNAHYETTLTQDEVDEILGLCNDPACNYLSEPVKIVMALSCDTGGCKTCKDYEAAKFIFTMLYPDPDFESYGTYLANYMNELFRFNLTYQDYLDFEKNCQAAPPPPGLGKQSYVIDTAGGTIITSVVSLSDVKYGVSVSYNDPDDVMMVMDTISNVNLTVNLIEVDTFFTMDGVDYHVKDSVSVEPSSNLLKVGIRSIVYRNDTLVASSNSVSQITPGSSTTYNSIPLPVYEPKLCGDKSFDVSIDSTSCYDQLLTIGITNGIETYHQYIDSVSQAFASLYRQKSMEAVENFTVEKAFNEYQYTLYYYDVAGNLVKTVPPAGVVLLSDAQITAVENHRINSDEPTVYVGDSLFSRYWFNTLDVPVKQLTPDADTVRFWYDRIGRLAVSQSARQRVLNQYSYQLYDLLGRIIESGQLTQTAKMSDATSKSPAALLAWIDAVVHEQIVHTYYDVTPVIFSAFPQVNLRNRIACIQYEDKADGNVTTYQSALYYSYDVSGNVKAIMYDIPELATVKERYKRMDYDYDLISGKVNRVSVQKDSADQFFYKYIYDADNRIVEAFTSSDGFLWETDAYYRYYDHGPLARTELGERQVQGLDYAYTINGWIKGINGADLNSNKDMGADGIMGGLNSHVCRDVYGTILSYFAGDYLPVGTRNFEPSYVNSTFGNAGSSLYNGNIRAVTISLSGLLPQTIGYTYKYDQLNRLMGMDAFNNFNGNTYKWKTSGSAINDWKEKIAYNPNGNIKSYIRHGNGSMVNMDSMTYFYNKQTNQLNHVDDGVSSGNYTTDIDDESAGNYSYDLSGNMIGDIQEGLAIEWNSYGKVSKITDPKEGETLSFRYDPLGNRLVKEVKNGKSYLNSTYYIRDGNGNILSVYHFKKQLSGIISNEPKDTVWWEEQHLYGSSRVGIAKPLKVTWPTPTLIIDTGSLSYYAGWKNYELTNHLCNVMAVISDKKLQVVNGSSISYYKPELLSAMDYYPFGAPMSGRNYSPGNYRFGFNDQEKDDEIKGLGNSYSFNYRIHDPRLGKFLSIDPVVALYPWNSPYAFAENRVIDGKDLEGLEYIGVNDPNVACSQQNDNGTYSLTIGDQDVTSSGIFSFNGQQYYNTCVNLYCTENGVTRAGKNSQLITQEFVSTTELSQIFPMATGIENLGSILNSNLYSFEIKTPEALVHFLAQAGHETGGFNDLSITENLNYTASGLVQTFPKYFSAEATPGKLLASDYARKPEAIGNAVYSNRMGNGDEASGDGYLFRGRGIFQLTGRDNYTVFQTFYNKGYSSALTLTTDPTPVATDANLAVISALWFFKTNVMTQYNLQSATVEQVTRIVNGREKGLSERQKYFNVASGVLK